MSATVVSGPPKPGDVAILLEPGQGAFITLVTVGLDKLAVHRYAASGADMIIPIDALADGVRLHIVGMATIDVDALFASDRVCQRFGSCYAALDFLEEFRR